MSAVGALFALWSAVLASRDAVPPPRWEVRVDLQIVAVPTGAALALVPELRRADRFEAANARVQSMLVSGEASLLGWPMLRGWSDTSTETHSIEEVRSTFSFEPPQIPGDVSDLSTLPLIVPPGLVVPTAIDTRNVGSKLSVEYHVDATGRNLDLLLEGNYSRLQAMEPAVGARSERLGARYFSQPRFGLHRIETALTLPNGRGTLLSVFVEDRPRPRTVLFLLHAIARRHPALLP